MNLRDASIEDMVEELEIRASAWFNVVRMLLKAFWETV